MAAESAAARGNDKAHKQRSEGDVKEAAEEEATLALPMSAKAGSIAMNEPPGQAPKAAEVQQRQV